MTFQVHGLCLSWILHPQQFCKWVWWYFQLWGVFRWRSSWVKILYPDPVPWSFFPSSHKHFHHSLKLCFIQPSIQTQRRKIKNGCISLCFLSGMSWKQPFWEPDKSFTHLSSSVWGAFSSGILQNSAVMAWCILTRWIPEKLKIECKQWIGVIFFHTETFRFTILLS